jgi:hypothetical protein
VAEKSGWLDKKGKRRWFVLTGGEFAWYDQPRQHQRGEKPNGSIPAKDASVAQIGEIGNGTHTQHATPRRTTRPTDRPLTPPGVRAPGYFVFAIYSTTARESEYLLQASSLTEMEDWVVALVLAGANPGKGRAASVVDEGTAVAARPDILPEVTLPPPRTMRPRCALSDHARCATALHSSRAERQERLDGEEGTQALVRAA